MPPMSRFEIDLTAVSRNVAAIRQALRPEVKICAVLKADAYGLGAVRIASQLNRSGVDMYAVYTAQQAQVVLRARLCGPVIVLAPVRDMESIDGLQGALAVGMAQLVVHDRAHVAQVEQLAAAIDAPIRVHVEADTGMSRGGVDPDAAIDVIRDVALSPHLILTGLYTHLSSADRDEAHASAQSEVFDALLDAAEPYLTDECNIHEANSFGVMRSRRHHRRMVRVGLLWAGYGPEEFGGEPRVEVGRLTPALRWMSEVVHLKEIEPGATVGYSAIWKADRRTRLALVAVGYADGYPISLSRATGEPVRGAVGFELPDGRMAYAPVVGRVSMDQITVDVTDLPESAVYHGAPAEIVGRDASAPNHLPTLARRAGTITHELLCRIGPPIHRRYVTGSSDTGSGEIARTTIRISHHR
jgi:alanine racemase